MARRMRWLSPPESVAAARDRFRYCKPTLARKFSRECSSLMMRSATTMSRAERREGRESTNSSACVTTVERCVMMESPPTVTARASFLSRLPPQSGQGYSPMYCSYSSRMDWLCVSR